MPNATISRNNDAATVAGMVIRVTCLCWIVAKLLSRRLWLTDRAFPLLPPADFLVLPGWMHVALFGLSLLLMVAIVIKPAWRWLLVMLLVCEVVSCLTDQNRWQPWQYQYLTTLLIVLLYIKNRTLALSAMAFVLFSTYLYSGLSKLHPGFIASIWHTMILERFLHLPAHYLQPPLVHYAGYAIPFVEIVAAVALLFTRTRRGAVWVLVCTHVFNLMLLGPFGLNYNVTVWPWNVCMPAVLYLVFVQYDGGSVSFMPVFSKRLVWVLVMWGVLPLTNYVGFWPDYQSSVLYAGRQRRLIICLGADERSYPSALTRFISRTTRTNICSGGKYISAGSWAMKEMNVPCNPEDRVYRKLQRKLQQQYKGAHFNFVFTGNSDTSPVDKP
jgi:hypothetical protein